MKKSLFILATAAIALASCNNDVKIAENKTLGNPNQQKEIGFFPLSEKSARMQAPAARAPYAVTTNEFPTDNTMEVKAYQTQPSPGAYFDKCTFSKSGTTWKGGQYWPLSAAKINFFAVSGYGVATGDITIANLLASATVEYKATGNTSSTDYSATTQSDIMYAFGRGAVTKDGNTLSFNNGAAVAMQFKHALALVDFEVKGATATEVGAITVNSITLKGATYNGTLTLTNTNAATESDAVTTAVSWTAGDPVASVAVPGIAASTAITGAYARIGNGLMVIPGTGFSSFVINYSLNGNTYDYEYTPAPAVSSTTANNKYTYRITFKLHEIEIAPTVDEWTNTNNDITIVN